MKDARKKRGILTVDVAVVDIAFGRGDILLIRRGKDPFKDKLALPGGHVESKDLTLRHAAQRELREETGFDLPIENLELLTVLDTPGRDPRGQKFSVVFIAYVSGLAERAKSECHAGDDASDIELRYLKRDWSKSINVLEEMAFDHAKIIEELRRKYKLYLEYTSPD